MAELDPDIANLIATFAADPTRPKLTEVPLAEGRALYVRQCAAFAGRPTVLAEVTDRLVEGTIPVRVYRPEAVAEAAPGLVFFHGGGWVLGSLETHDGACRRLAAGTGAVVVAVDYRLAPEHAFPAAVEDCYAAFAHVARHAEAFGIDPTRLMVSGDSAGGNLAAVVAVLARDAGIALAGQLLVYPATTGRTDTASYAERATGFLLERAAMTWFYAHYARDAQDADNPLFAPLRQPNLEGVAPAIIATAGFDPLRDDGRLYASALEKSGVAVRHLEFPSLTHGFFVMDGVSEAARQAGDAIAVAVRAMLRAPGASRAAPA